MVRDSFRKDKDAIIVDLRPELHQLSLFKSELTKILDVGTFDHTIAAFWYFVILTELLLALKNEIEHQAAHRVGLFKQAAEIDEALARLEISESGILLRELTGSAPMSSRKSKRKQTEARRFRRKS